MIEHKKTKYVFSADRFVKIRKNKIINVIFYDEIRYISYNLEFGRKDFIKILYSAFLYGPLYRYGRDAFIIDSVDKTGDVRLIIMSMSKENFERVKNIVPLPIEVL